MEKPGHRYTISANDRFSGPGGWSVWHVTSLTRMLQHNSAREAKAAVKRYEGVHLRRRSQNQQ